MVCAAALGGAAGGTNRPSLFFFHGTRAANPPTAARAALGADQRVEARQPLVAVQLLAGCGSPIVAAWSISRCFSPARASGVSSGAESRSCRHKPLDERFGGGQQCLDRLAPAGFDDIVGVLPRGQRDEAQRALGPKVGQGALARRGPRPSAPRMSPSKHRIGAGSSRHIRSSCASVSAVPLGATASAIPARSSAITSI